MTESEEVRSKAYREAAAAVDRFMGKFGETGPGLGAAGEGAISRLRAELGRVVDLNLDLVRNAFAVYGAVSDDRAATESVIFSATVPGATQSGIVWLHNFDDEERQGVKLVGTGLRSESGDVLDVSAWSFEPAAVDVPSRSGAPVLAHVAIPGATPPGLYRGSISAIGLDGPAMQVRVEVVSTDPIPHDSK